MFNLVLDKHPDTYQGFLIRTDFRIGIQVWALLTHPDLDEGDKYYAVINLLFGKGAPQDAQTILNCIKWYMSGGTWGTNKGDLEYIEYNDVDEEVQEKEANLLEGDIAYDFELDGALMESAFFHQYGIKLSETKMHWFEFLALFQGLKDTQFNEVMGYRQMDLSQYPAKMRGKMRRIKEKYKIRKLSEARKKLLIRLYGDEWQKYI